MSPAETRAASVLRQRLVLALVELAAEVGSAPAAVLHDRRDDLERMRHGLDNMRAVIEHDRRKAGAQ